MNYQFHTPVLLKEVLEALDVSLGKKYIDATVGFGGHGTEIVNKGGIVLGIDVDKDAIEFVEEKIKNQIANIKDKGSLKIVRANFREIDQIARSNNFTNVSGILFDLGVSSYQIDNSHRGFSFQSNAQLDMRMDKSLLVSAKELVNGLTQKELAKVFVKFGEEPRAYKIAAEIVKEREKKPIQTTEDLANIAQRVYGFRVSSKKARARSAKRIFQALRIVVNDELHALQTAIEKSVPLLEKGGKLVIISYHSLEERIVKDSFEALNQHGLGQIITKKPILPSQQELEENRRGRSARLRIFQKN